MFILLHLASFDKSFDALSERLKQKAEKRLSLFTEDSFNCILNNHKLHGEYEGCRSINVTGSLRIIYEDLGDSRFLLHDIGTHSQLYE
jgi:addiction module RelE/StbE family toxin